MANLKYIRVFKFDYAQYVIEDSFSNKGILEVDYKNNKYRVKKRGKSLDLASVAEISSFAQELLQRKRSVNFAKN